MSRIISVDIVLENCEVINAPVECIEQMGFHNSYDNFSYYNGAIEEYKIIPSGKIVLKNLDKLKNVTGWGDDEETPISRILGSNDITQLYFKYDDASEKAFYIYWYGDNSNYNSGMNTYIHSSVFNGDELHIEISNPNDNNQKL